jgi:hypothetical protein
MKLILILTVVAIAVIVVLMKKGKIADKDGNNIPDVLEEKVAEVKEVVTKAKKTTKKKATKE